LKRLALMGCALLAMAGASGAEGAPNGLLSADEIRAEFLGTRMSGVQLGTGAKFVECIEPGGRSIFQLGDSYSEATMAVRPEGQACFTYSSGVHCYRMQRVPKGYMVRGVGSRDAFHVRAVERDVSRCTAADLIG